MLNAQQRENQEGNTLINIFLKIMMEEKEYAKHSS